MMTWCQSFAYALLLFFFCCLPFLWLAVMSFGLLAGLFDFFYSSPAQKQQFFVIVGSMFFLMIVTNHWVYNFPGYVLYVFKKGCDRLMFEIYYPDKNFEMNPDDFNVLYLRFNARGYFPSVEWNSDWAPARTPKNFVKYTAQTTCQQVRNLFLDIEVDAQNNITGVYIQHRHVVKQYKNVDEVLKAILLPKIFNIVIVTGQMPGAGLEFKGIEQLHKSLKTEGRLVSMGTLTNPENLLFRRCFDLTQNALEMTLHPAPTIATYPAYLAPNFCFVVSVPKRPASCYTKIKDKGNGEESKK